MLSFHLVFKILLIAGALNWGSIALGYPDYVQKLAKYFNMPELDSLIKLLVGLAGLFGIYELSYYHSSLASGAQLDTSLNAMLPKF